MLTIGPLNQRPPQRPHRPGVRAWPARAVLVILLGIGVVVMHGLGDPSMDHGAAFTLLPAASHGHDREPMAGAAGHHGCHGDACDGSHSSDMVMVGCAYAVLALATRPRRVAGPRRPLRPAALFGSGRLSWAPEPPVPRFV